MIKAAMTQVFMAQFKLGLPEMFLTILFESMVK
jgi:hypothetical protein